jgi:hypothetical protein
VRKLQPTSIRVALWLQYWLFDYDLPAIGRDTGLLGNRIADALPN